MCLIVPWFDIIIGVIRGEKSKDGHEYKSYKNHG